jgi:hypothetical protein
MLVYLFRQRSTDRLAVTTDLTGRNLPPVTSSAIWLFVEAIDTMRLSPRWGSVEFQYAVRQAKMTGFYLF